MIQTYFKGNIDATCSEIDKKQAEYDLMLENIIDEGKQKKAEEELLIGSSKTYKSQTVSSLSAQPTAAQYDYLDEYRPKSR